MFALGALGPVLTCSEGSLPSVAVHLSPSVQSGVPQKYRYQEFPFETMGFGSGDGMLEKSQLAV
jgi:hypothetical protein